MSSVERLECLLLPKRSSMLKLAFFFSASVSHSKSKQMAVGRGRRATALLGRRQEDQGPDRGAGSAGAVPRLSRPGEEDPDGERSVPQRAGRRRTARLSHGDEGGRCGWRSVRGEAGPALQRRRRNSDGAQAAGGQRRGARSRLGPGGGVWASRLEKFQKKKETQAISSDGRQSACYPDLGDAGSR